MLSEADTRSKLIDPKLLEAGWKEDKITRERNITPGRLIDENGNRLKGKKPDYILLYDSSLPIAVVEAKEEGKSALSGMQQAKEYSEILGVLFAYSTNGHQIEEFDYTTNTQKTIENFPTPEELFERYLKYSFKDQITEVETDPLTYPYYHLPGGKYPWYFQEAAIKSVIEVLLKGQKRILLTMATGTGKTYAAFQITWKLLKSGYLHRVLYLADRNFLRDQSYNEFAPFEDARAIIEEGKAPKTRDMYFSIYQAMYSGEEGKRLYQQYPPDFFDLIIIDECHRSGYGTWKEILDYFGNAIHLGMTATPKRSDNIDTYAYFGEPVYSYSMGQGIEDGFLAPFQIYRSFTNVDKEGLHIRDALYQGAQVFVPEEIDLKDIYTLEDFEREIILPDRTEKICEHLANLLKNFGPLQKSIIFCVNMEHAAQVAKELQNKFAYLGYSDYAVRIVSEEPYAKGTYELFRDSEKTTPVVATTVDLLTTGVDVPSVRNVVFIKPLSSKVYFKQHIGRGCRIDPITNKYFFRIIDYVNATRLLDNWDYPSGAEPSKIVEGPFDLLLRGLLIDHENQSPISDAHVVAQMAPNMQRAARTDKNGNFVLRQLPHSPITIHVTKGGFRSRQLTITPSEGIQPIVIELKPGETAPKKIILKDLEVHIAEETKIILTANGKTLTDAEYIQYSKEGVISRVTTLNDLRKIWINSETRDKFLEELRNNSIYPELLASIIKIPDADKFDVIAHIVFGSPILTRDERANAFLNKKATFLNAMGDNAQEVILSLLDKYRIGGIEQISKPEIFRVPPFDKMGFLRGVAEIFGGFDELKETLDEVQSGLYGEIGEV
nr:DEAD/DEAH box helicase family protein [Candidatus Freyarchaeota archaeon]